MVDFLLLASSMTSVERQIGAWVENPGKDARIELRQIEIPKPGAGEVLVKIEVSGVWYIEIQRN